MKGIFTELAFTPPYTSIGSPVELTYSPSVLKP